MNSLLWPTVSAANPCRVCGKTDWCALGDRAAKCMRIASAHPSKDGGWYHFYGGEVSRPAKIPQSRPVAPTIDAEAQIRRFAENTKQEDLDAYAGELGVNGHSLYCLGAAVTFGYNTWAFPMRDGNGQAIGIRLRNSFGKKWAVTGSRAGIFLPVNHDAERDRIAMICEGPTDTAAALTLGYFAIGRPSCNSGSEYVHAVINRLGIRRVVIVCDDDTRERPDGVKYSPGIDGARALAKELKVPHVIWPPGGAKDIREFLQRGGTKQMIDASLRNAIWKR